MTPTLTSRSRPTDDDGTLPYVDDETLVLRSYDGSRTRTVTVRLLAGDDVVSERTYRLPPLSAVSVRLRLDRGVYRVDARLNADHADSAECLLGSAPTETALVEVGNGLVSVAEGVC
jgi:hypothetical protein